MAKKLYRAEVTSTFYYIAEEGDEERVADDIMEEALDDDREKGINIKEVTRFTDLDHWPDHECDVYGIPGSKTLIEAFEETTGLGYADSKEEVLNMYRLTRKITTGK